MIAVQNFKECYFFNNLLFRNRLFKMTNLNLQKDLDKRKLRRFSLSKVPYWMNGKVGDFDVPVPKKGNKKHLF